MDKISTRQELLEYSESIVNTVREPLIVLDQNLRVVTASRSFYDFFKENHKDTVGKLIYDLGNNQWNIPKLRELLETILPQKTSFDDYRVEHNFKSIGWRTMLLNARQIKQSQSKARIILLSIEDITERSAIQEGLIKANNALEVLTSDLESAAKVKSEFLANMSHELRTPLNSINGFSEVLYDETFGSLNEKQKQYVKNILVSGNHLLLLINEILDMAKIEAGKMTLTLCDLPIREVLYEITGLIEDVIKKKDLHMHLEINEDLPNISADSLKIKQVLYNLLSNVVKFTPEGGKIGVKTKHSENEIEIVIWDTGIGIAAKNMDKLFEGFFRIETPYSRLTEGTGLGLPIAKSLVKLHGGEFKIESEGVDKGTSVTITLPIINKLVVMYDENENSSSR
ncbi:HAMP domain-containing sensor histidine kinase [Shewanella sp. MEBiC00475]|uniref:sensor histidine kinase n=1 Tax=Shewanella sp. MEBiC00475 TaxID=2575361 RepID=UPI0010C0C049|nr:PAS domain-containing sensor histidine kinase [Shewanella sp. MEBiC00475]